MQFEALLTLTDPRWHQEPYSRSILVTHKTTSTPKGYPYPHSIAYICPICLAPWFRITICRQAHPIHRIRQHRCSAHGSGKLITDGDSELLATLPDLLILREMEIESTLLDQNDPLDHIYP